MWRERPGCKMPLLGDPKAPKHSEPPGGCWLAALDYKEES